MSDAAHLELVDAGAAIDGLTTSSGRKGNGRFLADLLVEQGLVDAGQVETAAQAARVPGRTLGSVLVDRGLLTEDELARVIAEHSDLDHLDLDHFPVDPAAVALLDEDASRRYCAVPVAAPADGALVVAVADPSDWLALDEIARATGRDVRAAVATSVQIGALLARRDELLAAALPAGGVPVVAPMPAAAESAPAPAEPGVSPSSPAAPGPAATPRPNGETAALRDEVAQLRLLVADLREDRTSDRAELRSAREHAGRMAEHALAAGERLARVQAELDAVRRA